jgi:hypothetical protein
MRNTAEKISTIDTQNLQPAANDPVFLELVEKEQSLVEQEASQADMLVNTYAALDDDRQAAFLQTLSDDEVELFNSLVANENPITVESPLEARAEQYALEDPALLEASEDASGKLKSAVEKTFERLKNIGSDSWDVLKETPKKTLKTINNLPLTVKVAAVLALVIGGGYYALEGMALLNGGMASHIAGVLQSLGMPLDEVAANADKIIGALTDGTSIPNV